jgi:uncharacterized protein DUF3618
MDPSGDRTAPGDRVAGIRAEIDAARGRLVGTLDGLRYKADVPARLGDSVGTATSSFVAHLIEGLTSNDSEGMPDESIAIPAPDDRIARKGDR